MLLHLPEWSSRYFGNIRLPLQSGNHQVGFDSLQIGHDALAALKRYAGR